MPSSLLVTSSDYQPASAVAWSDVPGLTIAVVAGTTYTFEFNLLITATATTTGHAIGTNGPAITYLRYSWLIPTTATAIIMGGSSIHDHAVTPSTATPSTTATAPTMTIMKGTFTPSASGTFACRIKPEVAAVMTVHRGSFGIVATP